MRTKLQPDEELVLTVKQHWIVLIKPLVVLLVVFFAYPELVKLNLQGFQATLASARVVVYGIFIAYFLYKIYDRKVNIWAVTNLRLIDEWGVITHHARESPLEKINNVDILQTIVGRLFNYGSVAIQTAATSGETWIRYVAKPLVLQETIMRMVRQRQQERDGDQGPHQGGVTVPANLNIIRCPHCGNLIPESALGGLRVSTVETELKASGVVVPQRDDGPIRKETSTAAPPPIPAREEPLVAAAKLKPEAAPVAERLALSELSARQHPRSSAAGAEDPFDWKRERG